MKKKNYWEEWYPKVEGTCEQCGFEGDVYEVAEAYCLCPKCIEENEAEQQASERELGEADIEEDSHGYF